MRRIATVALLIVCAAVFAAGCSASPAETTAAASSDRASLYGNWTKSEWDSASAQEKELAVVFLVEEAAASQGGDAEVVQSIVDEAEETLTAAQYSDIEDAITNYFDTAGSNATLQDALHDVEGTISKYVALG